MLTETTTQQKTVRGQSKGFVLRTKTTPLATVHHCLMKLRGIVTTSDEVGHKNNQHIWSIILFPSSLTCQRWKRVLENIKRCVNSLTLPLNRSVTSHSLLRSLLMKDQVITVIIKWRISDGLGCANWARRWKRVGFKKHIWSQRLQRRRGFCGVQLSVDHGG